MERLDDTTRKCRVCGGQARYRIIFMYRENKYYSIYLCEKHFDKELEEAKTKLMNSVSELVQRLKNLTQEVSE